MAQDRSFLDDAIANGFSNKKYNDYIFYMHILAQCKIILTEDIDLAGVNFKINKWCLYINPITFKELELEKQLGVIKHEMFHILYNHVQRKGDRQHKPFNVAADCALNQHIDRNHLPDGCIFPDTLEKSLKKQGFKVSMKKNENAETYYDLLPFDPNGDSEENGNSGECSDDCASKETDENGENKGKACDCGGKSKDFYDGLWEDNPLDNHEKWEESEGDELLKKDLTKRMVEKSMEKSRGSHIPNEIAEWLDIWSRKPQVSWKQVLKNIASNKKANKVSTIMRRDRRQPQRNDLRGHKKDRVFDIVVVLDISGSMSDDEIITGLNEIREVARITRSTIKIIQVDTYVREVEDFDPKSFERNGCGGTEMLPAWKYIKDNKISMDCAILISDMYIEDIDYWKREKVNPKCKTIFLGTENHMPDLSGYNNYIGFKLDQA